MVRNDPPEMKIKIKEKSWVAKIAAKKLRTGSVALVLGHTIHLWGANRKALLSDPYWLNHELKHVEQYLRYGSLWFLALYLWESMRKGYRNNKYEIEARAAEHTQSYLARFIR